MRADRNSPWQALFRLAAGQEGLFSARQAEYANCSQQLLAKYLGAGRIERVQRAVYRVVDFPPGEHEGLVAVWLWSRNEGVFSHETALFLHNLSDALPIRAHVSLPTSWKTRVLQIPEGIAIHHADVSGPDLSWVGPVPATSVRRTISDCLHGAVAPELIAQATAQAAERGLLSKAEILSVPGVSLLQLRSGS